MKNKSYIAKRNLELEAECSAIIQKDLSKKSKALLDLGACINLISLAMMKKISDL